MERTTHRVPVAPPSATVGEVRRSLEGRRFDTVTEIAICDRDRLVVGLIAASVIEAFEEQFRGRVILTFFVPAVVYLADAVGTQTEALVIRGLSVGVPIGRVVRRELLTGLPHRHLVARALPWPFHRLGTDAAFGSGPLATVVQDLLWILLYLVLGVAVASAVP